MVKSGHASKFPRLTFWNPEHAGLQVELASLSDVLARWPPGARGAVHRTDFHQLFVVRSGTATTTVDFVDHRCQTGTVVHVHPGRAVRFPRPAAAQGRVGVGVLLFTPSFLPRIRALDRVLGGPFGPVSWTLGDDRPRVFDAFDELQLEYRRAVDEHSAEPTVPSADAGTVEQGAVEQGTVEQGPVEPVTVELLRHLVAALLLRLLRTSAGGQVPASGGAGMAFRRFQGELERSFASSRTAAQYSAELGYSLKTLNRACQAATGSTAKDLIDDRVLLEAKRLLAHTDVPASTIAARLGFSEATNFGKFFTLNAGSTPSEFRAGEVRRSAATG